MEDEVNERKKQREEEKRIEMQRLDDLAKSGSTADRIHTDSSKAREDYLKEKLKNADEQKKT